MMVFQGFYQFKNHVHMICKTSFGRMLLALRLNHPPLLTKVMRLCCGSGDHGSEIADELLLDLNEANVDAHDEIHTVIRHYLF
ncbi:hypothetical protein M5K25_016536 [Dendrobium thyrsiflorum]|uniref:Uncharacterized protein n=1 Tax=Dendrobium thyrsiflorum TaxID=117978 RepID=A0ABD0UKG3_DENTH